MSTKTAPPPMGDNRPPELTEREIITDLIRDQVAVASSWMNEVPVITTQEQADRAADFKRQCMALAKRADEKRRAEKLPHDEAGKAVQRFWEPHTMSIERAKTAVDAKLTAFLLAEKRRIEAEREAARKAAEEAKRIAEREADRAAELERRANAGELTGSNINTMAKLEQAEQARIEAEEAEKRAAALETKKAGAGGSSTVNGVRKTTSLRSRTYLAFDTDPPIKADAVLDILRANGTTLINFLANNGELHAVAEEIHAAVNRVYRKQGLVARGFRVVQEEKAQ
jgi:hypothetical protein